MTNRPYLGTEIKKARILETAFGSSEHPSDVNWRGQLIDVQFDPFTNMLIGWNSEGEWTYLERHEFEVVGDYQVLTND